MEKRALTMPEIEAALNDLPGWTIQDGKLTKAYKFKSFAQALGWMVSAGIFADKLDHHPEWSNVYNRVQVALVTHDLGNVVSTLDVALAKEMDRLAA
jgi:4a-hydroxytetrahydrobiopterin dehydratase